MHENGLYCRCDRRIIPDEGIEMLYCQFVVSFVAGVHNCNPDENYHKISQENPIVGKDFAYNIFKIDLDMNDNPILTLFKPVILTFDSAKSGHYYAVGEYPITFTNEDWDCLSFILNTVSHSKLLEKNNPQL